VRSALGPNAGTGLDVVRVGETTEQRGFVTVRSRTPFRPLPLGSSACRATSFRGTGPAVAFAVSAVFCLCRPGPGLEGSWHEADRLPAAIKLTIRRRGERTHPGDFNRDAYPCRCARAGRLRAAGRQLRRQTPAQNNPQGGPQENPQGNSGNSRTRREIGSEAESQGAATSSSDVALSIIAVLWILAASRRSRRSFGLPLQLGPGARRYR